MNVQKNLTDSLKEIFQVEKCTFDLPSESQEQEALFIRVTSSRATIKDTRQIYRIEGQGLLFVNQDKMPLGYLSKAIAKADRSLTDPFFFFEMEENVGTYLNIAQRSFSFIYLIDSQYDPDQGKINEIDFKGVNP